MDNKLKILLGSEKNINSVNVDNYNKIELTKKESRITEFTVNDVVNATEQFDNEREANTIYRIYGRIEYLSLLNGLKSGYDKLEDFFNPKKTGSFKDIFNSFDFYLVAPSDTGYIKIGRNTNKYKRSFKVLAKPNNFEIYNAGFSNNVFGEQSYAFSFNLDFDVNNLYDAFGFPITELFLYAQYKKITSESMSYIKWSSRGNHFKSSYVGRPSAHINIGDNLAQVNGGLINDFIEYNDSEYSQNQIENQKYYIRTPYKVGSTTKYLEWSYNPLIPFKLRYFDGVLSTAKLSKIVENTTTLDVYKIDDSSKNKINATKSLKQNLNTITRTITNWDTQTNTYFNFNANTGTLKFLNSRTYKINFKTQIYLSDGTDKYLAETYLEKSTNGTSWVKIPNTTRKYLETNSTEGVIIEKYYNSGDYIRIRVGLIPNPNERKLEIIPDFATIIENDGKYVWRDIVQQGYTEPISNLGVDYPFFNGKRYLFSPITFSVVPNLSNESFEKHTNTINVFNEISFSDDATIIDKTPITELDNIGKPCQ